MSECLRLRDSSYSATGPLAREGFGYASTVDMATSGRIFKWMLWSFTQDYSGLQDEFIADRFRVRLMGNGLELTMEGSGVCSPELARILAESYVQILNRLIVVPPLVLTTEAEFLERTTPPFGPMSGSSTGRQDWEGARRAVREARNELLATDDPWLRRCYDHLQDALEHEMNPSPSSERTAYQDVYMAMEVLMERFGGQEGAVTALGKSVAHAKRFANAWRHIPKKGQQPPS